MVDTGQTSALQCPLGWVMILRDSACANLLICNMHIISTYWQISTIASLFWETSLMFIRWIIFLRGIVDVHPMDNISERHRWCLSDELYSWETSSMSIRRIFFLRGIVDVHPKNYLPERHRRCLSDELYFWEASSMFIRRIIFLRGIVDVHLANYIPEKHRWCLSDMGVVRKIVLLEDFGTEIVNQ